MNFLKIIYYKVSGIIEIIIAKVNRLKVGSKNRGKKYCYMICVKYKEAGFHNFYSFGFRVLNKKAALQIANQIEAANKTIYLRYLREAYGHHLHKLLDSIRIYLYNHNVLGEKHFRTHYNSIGNKEYFPSFYSLYEKLKQIQFDEK